MAETVSALFYLGKLIQAIGLVQVTYALVIGLREPDALGQELMMMTLGAGVFYLGRLLERRASV
ncbi:MAG TPA: hypothetical protein VEB21_18270 [Terriglobales bacterium]|nr:hypothetical protein [Terriglobales bacterium]